MTTYCQNASVAEVVFSLTGGREGRIVSYNPPVNILVNAKGKLLYIYEDWNGQVSSANPRGRIVFSYFLYEEEGWEWSDIIIPEWKLDTNSVPDPNSKSFFVLLRKNVANESGYYINPEQYIDTTPKEISFKSREPYFFRTVHAVKEMPRKENVFVISDKTGVLYCQSYPEGLALAYEVNCISCPIGEVQIQGETKKLNCIDAPRVITTLNNASKQIDSIYG